ncbi:MAG TPA: hypothetical protein VIC08_16175 [Cellvibrionaceae bacterium]
MKRYPCGLMLVTALCLMVQHAVAETQSSESVTLAEPATYVVPMYEMDNINNDSYYLVRALRLALDKTRQTHGDYVLQPPPGNLVDDRLKAAINQGYVDIGWFTSSASVESELRAITFSMLGELGHYRLLLVRRADLPRFATVENLDDLRQLKGGIGAQWVDAAVMRDNNLPYITATGYGRLFRMLSAARFDYFSRGLYQVYGELENYPELDLVVEPSLMLSYPNTVYFFVRKDNHVLAERIEKGLRMAQADGSLDTLFQSIPRFQRALEELANHQRKVLVLELNE